MQTIDAIWAKRAVEKLQAAGVQAGDIVKQARIKPYLLSQKSARIPFGQHAELLDLAARATGNSCFGLELAASEIDPRDAGLLAYAALSSETFGEALHVVERYLHVLNEAADVKSVRTPETVTQELQFFEKKASTWQAAEFSMAGIVRCARFLTGTHLRPIEVSFVHPRSLEIKKFDKFFGCPVRFRAKRNSVVFSRRQLALPIATADERLLDILTGYCEEILAERKHKSPHLRHQIERIAAKLLSRGQVEARAVADELGISIRTLARRLYELGLTFAQIVDELRFDLAQKYLRDPTLALSEITFLLGYSDVSVFSRAFRRWANTTPRQWRMAHK